MTDKLCVFCTHFDFEGLESESGPGWQTDTICKLSHWRIIGVPSADQFRKCIKKAVDCPDYEEIA